MRFSVEVPDAIAQQLHLDGADGERRGLQILAVEGYRRGSLSRGQVSELLKLPLGETEKLLKDHGCGSGLTMQEYEEDAKRLRAFLAQ